MLWQLWAEAGDEEGWRKELDELQHHSGASQAVSSAVSLAPAANAGELKD